MPRSLTAICVGIAALFFAAPCAGAQDLPPVAAPTISVAVNPLPVVRSQSEQVDDFGSGLIEGLMSTSRVRGVLFVAVKEDHVIVAKGYGAGIDADTLFTVPSLQGVLETIAVMQLVERGRLALDDDVAKALGEANPRGMTWAQVLLDQKGADGDVIDRAIERISGAGFSAFAMRNVFAPLSMMRSGSGIDGITTTATDMSRLLLALVNGGAAGNGRILLPETLDSMERRRAGVNPVVPGSTFGFAEMSRNGWRALEHDGERPEVSVRSRLVIVPEARLAYFLLTAGPTTPTFWRTLDNALFDRLLPAREELASARGAPPSAAEARAAAGTYVPSSGSALAFLKVVRQPLQVQARADGALVISGAENTVLLPHAGGYWRTAGTEIPAVFSGGRLVYGDVAYAPCHIWARPTLYAWLALFFGVCAVLAFTNPAHLTAATGHSEKAARTLGLGFTLAMFLSLLIAVSLQRLVFGT